MSFNIFSPSFFFLFSYGRKGSGERKISPDYDLEIQSTIGWVTGSLKILTSIHLSPTFKNYRSTFSARVKGHRLAGRSVLSSKSRICRVFWWITHSVLRKAMGLLYIMASIESTGVPGYCAPVINFEVLHGQLQRWLGHRWNHKARNYGFYATLMMMC